MINTATVTDSQGVTGSSTASTTVTGAPNVSIVKTVTSVGGCSGDPAATYAGEVIDYQIVVANTGDETLTNVVVKDTTLGTTLGTLASLAAGASVTYTEAMTVTQAEINSGTSITNTATVTDSQTPSQSSTATTAVAQSPSVSIVKTVTSVGGVAGDPAATAAGEAIDYQIVVSNTGNETLTNVVVTDTTLGTTLGTLASLAPGASATYTVVTTVTQAELNSLLPITNTATVTDSQTPSQSSTASTAVEQQSSISVIKLPNEEVDSSCGVVTFTFDVTNTGTSALTDVVLTDNIGTASNPDYVTPTLQTSGTNGTLAPGQTWVYTVSVDEPNVSKNTSVADTATVTAMACGSGSSGSTGLSAATILADFNAVVFGNASTSCDIEGAIVVGGNFSGATVYDQPSGSLPSGYGALTVFGSTSGNSINIDDGGSAYVGGSKGAGINFNGGGKYIGAPSASIGSFSSTLDSLSQSLSQLSATGTLPTTGNNEVITAHAGANGIAVIDLTAAQLAAIPSFTINMNGASSLIFNVSGTSATFNANDESGITGADNIIWNFYQATGTVAINTQIGGTVLAPYATVTNNNQIDGALVAQNYNGSGELHDYAFTGNLPSSCTTVTASDSTEVQDGSSGITVGGNAPTGSLSSLYGTAEKLEFTYDPGNTVSLVQNQAAMASVTGSNSNAMAFLEISNISNPYASNATIYFEGEVQTGEQIFADATINQLTNTANSTTTFSTTAGTDTYAYVFASQAAFESGAAPIQTMAYNTSGSQAMHVGDEIGSLTLAGFVGTKGGYLVQ
ncbi:MAG TPA: choice-of-anchor A family protein [Acetobacteraceae bacterium]|nr:choice-of-anchor A family protein [Acetobacteraceae bacterium]